MPGYWCHYCQHPRAQCPPGEGLNSCAITDAAAQEYQDEMASGIKRVYIASMPGGTTDLAKKMDQSRAFNKDMYAYEDAVRAGENPDGTTRKAVERTRRRQESHERAMSKIEGWAS